ncbi:twin-arginine translocation signal domain-containing protein, partial [Vibrio parahaemolyticus]|uniref:twin-arginine translocation signal domain-containing protein n=1 Tax=Vibrio parahaemolyticus TaxID=670 RepID=UPI001E508389
MAITRRSFLKGVATTSAASVIGPSLLASASANAAESDELTGLPWEKVAAKGWIKKEAM